MYEDDVLLQRIVDGKLKMLRMKKQLNKVLVDANKDEHRQNSLEMMTRNLR